MRDDVLSCSNFSSLVNGFGLADLEFNLFIIFQYKQKKQKKKSYLVRLLFDACSTVFLFLDELRLCLDDRLDDLDVELDELDLELFEPLNKKKI